MERKGYGKANKDRKEEEYINKLMTQLVLLFYGSAGVEIIRRGADKSLALPICSTTKRIFLGWVKEVKWSSWGNM
jgi:hypothetical protein